jgi:hypothetical protein
MPTIRTPPQPAAYHRFGLAAVVSGHPNGIYVGRVDEVEPGTDQRIQYRK